MKIKTTTILSLLCLQLCCYQTGLIGDDSSDPMAYSTEQKDCKELSIETKQFAAKLTPDNQSLFCTRFNDLQRSMAMELADTTRMTGKAALTPDAAVQKIAADNNIKPAPKNPPIGCPVN